MYACDFKGKFKLRKGIVSCSKHKKDQNSALSGHSMETDHNIIFSNTEILASDSNKYRLKKLKIQKLLLSSLLIIIQALLCTNCGDTL